MNKTNLWIAFLGIFSTSAIAGGMETAAKVSWSRVLTLSGGPAWMREGKSTILFVPPIPRYVATKKTQPLVSGELFFGLQRTLSTTFAGQLGLALSTSSHGKVKGFIFDNANSTFNNFRYHYKINHAHVAVKAKLLGDLNDFVQPYFSASVGLGFNRTYGFTISTTIFQQLPPATFNSRTNTAFTYTLGIGLQKALGTHVQVSVGYELADWGKNGFAHTSVPSFNTGLQLSHLFTHQAQFSLSYLT